MIRKNDGFTLIELVVAMAASVTVMAAAFTVLMFGTRVEAQTTDIISDRQSVTLQMANLDSLVQSSEISKVEILADDWILYGKDEDDNDVEVMSYDANTQTISSSTGITLSDVTATLSVSDNYLLTLELETENGSYSISTRCHKAISAEATNATAVLIKLRDEKKTSIFSSISDDEIQQRSRYSFVLVMATQHGSTGNILGDKEYDYFSQWYNENWPSDTPWCACFISWALDKVKGSIDGDVPSFAGVKNGIELFKDADHKYGAWAPSVYYPPTLKGMTNIQITEYVTNNKYTPLPGDVIFFDWTVDTKNDYDHVGAVLYVDGNTVYTIEGNSNNKVAIRGYDLDDPCIIGYGVLNWVKDSTTSGS